MSWVKFDLLFGVVALRNELTDLANKWTFSGPLTEFVHYREVPERVLVIESTDGMRSNEERKEEWLARNGL